MSNERSHSPRQLPSAAGRPLIARRRFLRLGGAGLMSGAAALAGMSALERLGTSRAGASLNPAAYSIGTDADPTDRILVVIQLSGGLDFLNAVVPRSGRYHDLRGRGAVNEGDLLALDDGFGFNPNLPHLSESWANGDLAIVHGVGLPENSLSHFVDTDVWTRGRVEAVDGTGWIGRALDGLAVDADPLIGVSIGGLTPAMYAPGWNAVALPEDGSLPWSASFIEENPGIVAAYQQLLTDVGRTNGMGLSLGEQVRASQQLVRTVADTVGGATDLDRIAAAAELFEDSEGDSSVLGAQLSLISDLINGGLPTRAYHVELGGFDTHANQATDFPLLMTELDTSIANFRNSLGANADKVVIATWTEFGRRPEWNGSGTDHGTAGTQLVVGADVNGGHFGEPVSLKRFDRHDNFLVTTPFNDYLGGLSQSVLGVDADRVVPGTPNPMELIA